MRMSLETMVSVFTDTMMYFSHFILGIDVHNSVSEVLDMVQQLMSYLHCNLVPLRY